MSWYVLYTKPRNEKKLAQILAEKGIEVYCPVREEIKQWSDRKKKVSEPVFKSYLFINLNDYKTESPSILSLHGAVRFVWWLGKPGIVREEELAAIRNFISEYKDVEITTDFKEGQQVTIMEGPLREKTGTVIQVKGDKAYLHLHSLGIGLIAKVQVHILSAKA